MTLIYINSNTKWISLPWTKIYEKVIIIQKKIYQYSKEFDKCNIHRLQKHITNSSDIKILATQLVLNSLNYYSSYHQKKYRISDSDKFMIYKSLLNKHLYNQKFNSLVEKVKQYIIYLCVKPEWEARFEPIYKSKISNISETYFISRLNKFIHCRFNITENKFYYLNYKIINKYIDCIYLKQKMQAINTIQNCISYWLENQSLSESITVIDSINIEKWSISNNFCNFLFRVISNGILWFAMLSLQQYYLYTQLQYNIFREYYLLFDSNNNYLIYTHQKIIYTIYLHSLKLFHQAVGLSNKIYIYHNCISQNIKHSIISDYLLTYCFNNIHKSLIRIKQNKYIYLLKQIRYEFYHKDVLGRWRLNNQRNINKISSQLNTKYVDFYIFYNPVINFNNTSNLSKLFKGQPQNIYFWNIGSSRMKRKFHVRFCKRGL